MTIEFGRGPDKKKRKRRSDSGLRRSLGNARKNFETNRAKAKRRREMEDEILEDRVKRVEAEKFLAEDAAAKQKFANKVGTAKTIGKIAGGAGLITAGVLAARRGVTVGKLAYKGGKAARGVANEAVKGFTEGTVKATKKGAKKAAKATKETVKKVPKAQQTVNTGKATRKAFEEGLKAPSDNSKASRLGRFLGRQARKVKKKAEERKKRKNNFSKSNLNQDYIGFSKKKSVQVKGYVRKDGVKVRPSTREVLDMPPPDGAERIARISLAARPFAEALSIAANAFATVLGAKDAHRRTNRELSALGETRKFLGVAGSAGTGIGQASRGFGALRSMKGQLALKERALKVKEANSRAYGEFNTNYGISVQNKVGALDLAREQFEDSRKKRRRKK